MEVKDQSSYSVDRLDERIKQIHNIDILEVNKLNRIVSLHELRKSVFEKRRQTYFDHLKTLSNIDVETAVDLDEEVAYVSPKDDEPYGKDAVGSVSEHGELQNKRELNMSYKDNLMYYGFINVDIDLLLVWPEYIVGLDSEIALEAAAISKSLVCVRPEGRRVVVIIRNDIAIEYCKKGHKNRSFKVNFSRGLTILDCVIMDYGEADTSNLKYYVLDVLIYNNCVLAHSDTECRIFFIRSRLEELQWPTYNHAFVPVEYYECTPKTLLDLYYGGDIDYVRDSLLFVDKSTPYIGGYNPNWLCWKDYNLRYMEGVQVYARVINDGTALRTIDGVLIGELDKALDEKMITILIKNIDTDCFKLLDYEVLNRKSHQVADSMRKIVNMFMNSRGLEYNVEHKFNRLVQLLEGLV